MSDIRFLQLGFEKQLAHVVEEAGEVLAAAGKTQRWGRRSTNPLLRPGDLGYGETNEEWLQRELNDLEAAVRRIRETMEQERGLPISGWAR